MVRVISLGWSGLIAKCRFIFPRVFPLVSDRSVWHDGSTLYFMGNSGRMAAGRTWDL